VKFLHDTAMRHLLKQKILLFRAKIIYIQQQLKGNKRMAESRMQVLLLLWNRELSNMQMKTLQVKDRKNKEAIKDLANIKEEVKLGLLQRYMEQCELKHSLALF